MAPIPGVIRGTAQFENQNSVYWTYYDLYTKITTTDTQKGYSKPAGISHKLQDKWVVIASVLFAILVVGLISHLCFWGRHKYPRQTASTEDKMKMENVEHLNMVEESCSDGWMCFILACHAAITLGVV
ncbi:uncharacterized protein N7500_000940 [Penicillium coprophilum]|uniref:uncharacterized protein n=1 Tax=Penicillium coprophilum TaxID=36646 RepID=UPI0023A30380|nr:uncharacterized protein N7500_000940 [Penicillium coprophilum]KAJ5178241.1 hypothetical protein N7500_000940 [Penicillium coprophilum]